MAVKWKFNIAGFADLRNDPKLVAAMESAMRTAAAGTPFEVEVAVFPHAGRRSGPRTSVQAWAASPRARAIANKRPDELTAVLNRVHL